MFSNLFVWIERAIDTENKFFVRSCPRYYYECFLQRWHFDDLGTVYNHSFQNILSGFGWRPGEVPPASTTPSTSTGGRTSRPRPWRSGARWTTWRPRWSSERSRSKSSFPSTFVFSIKANAGGVDSCREKRGRCGPCGATSSWTSRARAKAWCPTRPGVLSSQRSESTERTSFAKLVAPFHKVTNGCLPSPHRRKIGAEVPNRDRFPKKTSELNLSSDEN